MMRFNDCAETYATHARVQREMADWLAEWLPGLEGVALEYGAGEGMFTRLAFRFFSPYYAVDIAPKMVEQGARITANVQWQVGDAWSGAGPGLAVDAIMSSSLLQWAPDPVEVLSCWRKRLKPDGAMLHGLYIAPTLPELYELMPSDSHPLAWRSESQWRAAFASAGLAIERMESESREVLFSSALELLRSLHGVGAVRQARMPVTMMRKLLRDYEARHSCPEGGVFSTWTYCRVLAKPSI